MIIFRSLKTTLIETAAILISVSALACSIWAVLATREATLQARRAEVRSTLQATLALSQSIYANAVCVLKVAKQFPEAQQLKERYEKSARALDEIRGASEVIQKGSRDVLDGLERQFDGMYGAFRELRNAVVAFKADLSTEELERVNNVCGTQG